MRNAALIVALLAAGIAAALLQASMRWNRATRQAIQQLPQLSHTPGSIADRDAELVTLPTPVQRYFRVALGANRSIVRTALIEQTGTFLMRPEPNGWRPFTATHHATTLPRGFVWDAKIRMLPGVTVRVRDALLRGVGATEASIAGVRRVAYAANTPEMAAGALHRYLAESVWFPTALLPSSGVQWTAIDDSSARATVSEGETTVWLDFHFGKDGLVERVYTPARERSVNGGSVPTAWQATYFRYALRDGLLVPLEGEVSWLLPDGPQPYWRGRLTRISFSRASFPEGAPQ